MRESFLHFIWQFQKFDAFQLSTADNKSIRIFSIGQYNTDAGPDFLNANVTIDEINWHGHVEIHLKSSDWNNHKHHHDPGFNNVILHVVWEHDQDVKNENGHTLPVIEIKDRVAAELIRRCDEMINSPAKIPCESQISNVNQIERLAMLNRSGVQRLETKSIKVLEILKKNDGSWEETTYQLLSKNFGLKTNSEPFFKLAEILPYRIISKHTKNHYQLESLFFGVAGFLTNSDEGYANRLQSEYLYLAKKYNLKGLEMIRAEWKFLRMRPANFPTVRLAQFSAFYSKNVKYFDHFIHFSTVVELRDLFSSGVSDYWKSHYDFGKKSSRIIGAIGKSSVDLILVNTIAPLLTAYAKYSGENSYLDKAVELLQSLKPEKNHIIRQWENLSVKPKDAFDSQSIIHLHNEFCLKKKCLSCKIGVNLLNH